ncbi:hypothetical protein D1007_59069 [Hordeum vulgare]|nr:hypothetical protein D1007_59069 [Hordeum vulgare]
MEALQHEVAEAREAHVKQVPEVNAKLTDREEKVQAAADAKTAADRVTLSSLEVTVRQVVSSICRMELESPIVSQDAGYAEFSSEIMKELEGTAKKVDYILEEECRDLLSLAVTRMSSHLLLRDPHFKFEEVMGTVPEESRDDLAVVVEVHVHTLLKKFSYDDYEEPSMEPPLLP